MTQTCQHDSLPDRSSAQTHTANACNVHHELLLGDGILLLTQRRQQFTLHRLQALYDR